MSASQVEAPLLRIEAQERGRLIADVAYEVQLDLTQGDTHFASATTITFTCTEPGARTFLDLIGTAHEVTLNGHAQDIGKDSRIQLVDLQANNTLTVRATCAYQTNGAGLHRSEDPVDGAVYLHTQFAPIDARRVFACFDQPDLKGTFELIVTAPEDWVVISNERGSTDKGVTRFAKTPQLSTYLMSLMAGHYASAHTTHQGLELGLYCRRTLRQHLAEDEVFADTKKGLDWYTEVFGRPYPFTKYDQLFVPEFRFGGMENPGCITYHEKFVHRGTVTEQLREARSGVLMHEMAHMWFGDLVTMRWWDDLWLNESFATFMGSRAMADALGYATTWAGFASGTKAGAYAADQLPTTHPISADISDTGTLMQHFDAITYNKGASVLKQLAHWVGMEAFDTGVREYFDLFAFDNAELKDLLECLERASGRDLKTWSAEWLCTAGVTRIRVQDGLLTQVGDRPLPSHRLSIAAYSGSPLAKHAEVELDLVGASGDLDLPVADLILPNDRDLTYALVGLDDRSMATVLQRLSDLDDPLARALCWSACWEMLRDATLPASRFLELVVAHATHDPEISTVERLLGQASAAIEHYGAIEHREPGREVLAKLAEAQLATAEPGGDLQLLWARMLLDASNDRGFADGLLNESDVPEGLKVDVDLRWAAVAALVVRHGASVALLDQELALDPSDIGQRRARALRAQRPDVEEKAAAWTLLTDPAVPASMRLAVGGAFWVSGQEDLTRPYVDRYVEQLPAVWSGGDADLALSFSRSGFPSTIADDDAIGRLESLRGLPEPAERVLSEGLHELRRLQRTRSADGGVRSEKKS